MLQLQKTFKPLVENLTINGVSHQIFLSSFVVMGDQSNSNCFNEKIVMVPDDKVFRATNKSTILK